MNYIYRDYSCTISTKNCSQLLQSLALTGGAIVSSSPMSNGFPDAKVGRWEMHFKLRFSDAESLNKFHDLGLETSEPERIAM